MARDDEGSNVFLKTSDLKSKVHPPADKSNSESYDTGVCANG